MLNHHIRFFHYLPFLKKQLNEIYLVHSINGFVFSLIGIFIPIYLLTLGYSVSQVLIFYIIKHLAVLLFSFITGYISNHFGLKHTMIMRFPVILIFLLMLYSLELVAFPLSLIALLGGFQTALYWIPLHSLFARNSGNGHMGSDVSKLYSFPQMASIIAPLIGGFITIFFGFSILFIIAMILLIVSMFPLFYTSEIKPHVNFQIKKGVKIFKKYPKYFFGVGVNHLTGMTESVIWPIFVYLILANILSIGIIGTLLGAGSILFILIIGKFSDRFDRRRIIKIGAILMILIWLLRAFISTEMYIYLLTILAGFFTVLIFVPFTSITYDLAKRNNIDEFIIFREIPVAIGGVLILLLALILVAKLELTFLLASIAHIFFLFF